MSCFPSFWLYTRLSGRYRKGLKERLGFVPRMRVQDLPESPRIWLHAVSLGEVKVAVPMVRSLKRLIPDCSVILSA
ncbi:MAG: 3-deoxy-D-manno-octulosonic acid transferase, partial [Desulfobacterales bacterium]|nr:3-deoxy-D-manno-octulosonic acid transferase [Desulfobacterales bacterium]